MSLITTLKRALGFAATDDEEELDSPTGYVNPFAGARPAAPAPKDPEPAPEKPSEAPADELERLNEALRKVSAERDASRRAQLSAERQKSALTDRIYDLEKRLSTLEAERDRLFTENRRMEVQLKTAPGGRMPMIAPGDTAAQALKAALDEEQKASASLRRDIEALAMKAKIADTMVADLTAKASTANREATEARRDLEAALADRARLKKQLADANDELNLAAKAVERIGDIESYKEKTDMRIAELQRLVALKDKEIRSLNSTIEHNLRRHAEAQELLRREIEKLRAAGDLATASDVADIAMVDKPEPSRRSRRQAPPTPDKDDSQLTLF